MAQVQFRSDDTSLWGQKFGNGSDGVKTISSNTTDSPTKTTFSGTSGASTGTVGSNAGFAIGNIVIIHQSREGGPTVGTWQLNYIVNISGTTFTFLYPLVASFASTAQIQKVPQYSALTINGGSTLTGAAWNGTTGGMLVYFINGPAVISGTISVKGIGYRGGSGNTSDRGPGSQGEGTVGVGTTATTANGNSGGGGQGNTGPGNQVSAGGGSEATGGTDFSGSGGGAKGNVVGSADLTVAPFGGSGGGGGTNSNGTAGQKGGTGGNGGGFMLLVYRSLTCSGNILGDGNIGGDSNAGIGSSSAAGAGGAGGCILLKGQTTTLGSNLVTSIGGLTGDNAGAASGAGGTGYIHLDYLNAPSGTTNPSLNSRLDTGYIDGFFGGMI